MDILKKWDCSEKLCEQLAERSDTVILSFSAGKDSIASWLQLRRYFKKIIAVYMYPIPDLDFIEKSLAYYEEYFGQHIYRLPHPNFIKMLNSGTFQTPENFEAIQKFNYPNFDYKDVINLIREDYCDNDKSILNAVGCRFGDSPWRNIIIKKHSGYFEKSNKFYPVYDWNNERLKKEFLNAKIKLPIDYQLFGRSFDGVMALYTIPIKKHFPDDYEKIKKWFPLVDADVKKHEYGEKHGFDAKTTT